MKIVGYKSGVVRDPEGRGVALLVMVKARGVRDVAHVIDGRLYPRKQREGTCHIVDSEVYGSTYEVTLLIGAATQQTGTDAVRAVAAAANVSMNDVTYTDLAGILCHATQNNPGSPRAGAPHRRRRRDEVPHR